jgi:glutamyl-queuosine tRNA(Asp) synthetase
MNPSADAPPPEYRGRLAPSPTGHLHLGHASTFWTAQARARERGGALVLRIEDLDRERCKPGYDAAILEDLRWLGFQWQEGPDIGGAFGPYRQSERMSFYLDAWQQLAAAGMIYPCACSRKDVERALQAPHAGEGETIYPGICRPAQPSPPAQDKPDGWNWRFRATPGETVAFEDGRAGPQSFRAGRDFGDFLVWRKDGMPAYQLAVVVDDAAMRISEVVRGADLLASTAQQLLLYRALGLMPPAFYHCPLVADAHGQRLAKRTGAHSLRRLREAGADPSALTRQMLPSM